MGLAVMIMVFFAICQAKPSIPADMIPNTWSDFDFWGEKITTFKNSIQHILFIDKSEVELGYFRPLTSMVGYAVVAVIMFFCFGKVFQTGEGRRLVWHDTCRVRDGIDRCVSASQIRCHDRGKENDALSLAYFVIGQFIFRKKTQKLMKKRLTEFEKHGKYTEDAAQ
mgnify:CR=1 FL=1